MPKQIEEMLTKESLINLTQEELIEKLLTLHAHNKQLQNIIRNLTQTTNTSQKPNQKPFDFTKCTFRHILIKFYYLGWDCQGYAVQEDTSNTIEHHLFAALTKTCLIKDRASANYHRCGRTDKGVSSFSQTISITVRSKLTKEEQNDLENEIDYCGILNRVLPDYIQCVAWCPVEEGFSARFDCISRTYKYFFVKDNLDIEKMQKGAEYLIGTHDFRNFCKMDVANGVTEFVRNISEIIIEPLKCTDETNISEEYSQYVATITAKAFLWHQIRCVMGVLFLIGQNVEKPEVIKDLLDVNSNPRKPSYNMANEIPLNLYQTNYKTDLNWQINNKSLQSSIQKLKCIWALSSTKATMVRNMLLNLENFPNIIKEPNNLVNKFFIPGIQPKSYQPLLKRQKCDSLEDRLKRHQKKQRLNTTINSNKS